MAFGEQFKQLFIWGSTYTFLCIDNDKLLSPTSCVGKYFILIRRCHTLWIILPTFDVMQPTNQPWSISVAIYFPQLTHQNRESRTTRTTTSFYPWEFLHTTIISSGLTLGSYFRYESSMVGSIPMVTAIIGEMTIVFVITLQQACNLLPNESTIWDRGKIDCIVLFAKC